VTAIPPLNIHDHILGPDDAPLELVMYGDFQCPYCAAAQSIVRRVRERLDGRLRFAFRHLPLTEIHPLAQTAAEGSEAAARREAFWPMHDRLYAARGRLALEDVVRHAEMLELDGNRIRIEIRTKQHAARVRRDAAGGTAAGVTGTPAFFVNGVLLQGAFDAGSLVEALEASG